MGEPGILVHAMMLAWAPAVIAIFVLLPPRRAVLVAFLAAWMFLPVAEIRIAGMPDYNKTVATCVGVLFATLLFDLRRMTRFRPSLLDLPIVLFCLSPLAASLTNGLGVYDGLSETFRALIKWALPYLIGKLYFSDTEGAKELAFAVFLGGLIYVPFCLFEVRMSPQLHRLVYGYHQHSFAQTIRYGGFRPMVFMDHGLMVGMWMAAASTFGAWMLFCGTLSPMMKRLLSRSSARYLPEPPWEGHLRHLAQNPGTVALVLLVLLTALLVKSTGALLLMVAALGALLAAAKTRNALPILLLIAVPPAYILSRAIGKWDGREVVRLVQRARPDRAQSLQFRLDNEDLLIRRALQRPVFGWGGWGRSRVYDDEGRDITVTDGLWIILLGTRGLFGLITFTAAFMLPIVVFWRRFPLKTWARPDVGPLAVMSLWMVIYMIDNIPNDMPNPMFVLMLGALLGFAGARPPGPGTVEGVESHAGAAAPHPERQGTRIVAS